MDRAAKPLERLPSNLTKTMTYEAADELIQIKGRPRAGEWNGSAEIRATLDLLDLTGRLPLEGSRRRKPAAPIIDYQASTDSIVPSTVRHLDGGQHILVDRATSVETR